MIEQVFMKLWNNKVYQFQKQELLLVYKLDVQLLQLQIQNKVDMIQI